MSTVQIEEPKAEQPEAVPSDPTESEEYKNVVSIVSGWSPSMRAALMHAIVDTLVHKPEGEPSNRSTMERAIGLAKIPGRDAPSDEEVEQWLDEHRMEKYG